MCSSSQKHLQEVRAAHALKTKPKRNFSGKSQIERSFFFHPAAIQVPRLFAKSLGFRNISHQIYPLNTITNIGLITHRK